MDKRGNKFRVFISMSKSNYEFLKNKLEIEGITGSVYFNELIIRERIKEGK